MVGVQPNTYCSELYLLLAIVLVAQLVTKLSDISLDNDHDYTLLEETCLFRLLPPTLPVY